MKKSNNLQLTYEKLTKSIKTKIELVGDSDNIDSLDLADVKDFSLENIKRLQIIEGCLKKRVTNYNCILNFFNPLTTSQKANLRKKSDVDFEEGTKIIKSCDKKALLYEQERGMEIRDLKSLLSKSERSFFDTLFAPSEEATAKNPSYRNVDEKEEYLTEEELETMYGSDNTVDEINRRLGLNIGISD